MTVAVAVALVVAAVGLRGRGRGAAALAVGAGAVAACVAATVRVPGTVRMRYGGEGCTPDCAVVAGGWPLPWVADHPGLSPVNSVSVPEAVFGIDTVLWGALAADVALWGAAVWALVALASRGPRGGR